MPTVGQPPLGPQTGADIPDPLPTFTLMRAARRWLIANPDKRPLYINGQWRHGTLDSPEDVAQLASYHDAKAALAARGDGWLLGFALGPDGSGGHWQGVDLDDVRENRLADLANGAPGYVEMSPSGEGAHAIGYGRHFATLGPNGTGVEAYAAGRYFTVTERPIRDSGLTCLSGFVEQALAPRHCVRRTAGPTAQELVQVDPKTVAELRSALLFMLADDRHLWVRMGHALWELGDVGRGLWLEWSATSLTKFDPKDAAEKWSGFGSDRTGYQAVFAEAQRQGWVNPGSGAAQLGVAPPPLADPSGIELELAMASDTATVDLEYLVDPYLPRRCVVGFFGRGGTAKSSFLASMSAHISGHASTLWVSVEEPRDWIRVRHIKAGGAERTLAVVSAVPKKKDAQGRVIASNFNVYEHLEPAIFQAKATFQREGKPPLGLVSLDTAVGLTGWAKGENANDDGGVKRLLGYLQHLAETHDVTIAFVGHANKGKHDHFADTVMGATAWTNSPRLSFIHARDRRDEYSFVVRVAKTNLVTFGAPYTTVPVHTLYARNDGPDSVLCRVEPGPIVWGDAASLEMWDEATRKPDAEGDESGGGGGPMPSLVVNAIQALVELVMAAAPDAHVTREDVEQRLGRTVDRPRWRKVDDHLHLHPTVLMERGPQNRVLYRRRT